MPKGLVQTQLFSVAAWQWLGILASIVIGTVVGRLTGSLLGGAFERLARKTRASWDDTLADAARGPLRPIIAVLVVALLLDPLRLPPYLHQISDHLVFTLLVVSLETPQTVGALRDLMRGFLPFALTFAMVCWIWYEHNVFFRRYGLQDPWTAFLNSVLLFVVLFYVYPLKFLTGALFSSLIWRDARPDLLGTAEDGRAVMLLYSAGVVMIFWPEIASTGARPTAAYGLAIGLAAVLAACIGNVLTLTLTRRGLPLVPVLAWSMGYGAVFLLVASLATGQGLNFAWTSSYVLSLLYLAVFGSVIAFVLYFKLAQRQGTARAALTGVVIPVIALGISAIFEGWRPTLLALAGMVLCLGSIYAATRPQR